MAHPAWRVCQSRKLEVGNYLKNIASILKLIFSGPHSNQNLCQISDRSIIDIVNLAFLLIFGDKLITVL